MSTNKKLLCYELNEVPWRVLDHYCKQRPQSFLAQNIGKMGQATTHTRDSGELHPWCTWPTMHRGVPNDIHEIRFINQDLTAAKAYPPVWEILMEQDIRVGVFGSLQSYPPLNHKAVAFHIPDTFAPEAQTFPEKIQPFQEFNLLMAGKNKATAAPFSIHDALNGLKVLRTGITMGTLVKTAQHLTNEVRNPLYKGLRPTLQAHFSFDVFYKLLAEQKPEFATFFTNHVAGLMHRYWKCMFPEDSKVPPEQNDHFEFHQDSILKGMDIADQQIETLSQFAQKHGYDMTIASSMGQEAIDRGEYLPELTLRDPLPLTKALGFEGQAKLNPAMQPDVAFEFVSVEALQKFQNKVLSITDTKGQSVIHLRYPPKGLTLNLVLAATKHLALTNRQFLFNEKVYPVQDLGFEIIERDQGTGYHCPEGIWLWWGQNQPQSFQGSRQVQDSCTYLPAILEFFDVDKKTSAQPSRSKNSSQSGVDL